MRNTLALEVGEEEDGWEEGVGNIVEVVPMIPIKILFNF